MRLNIDGQHGVQFAITCWILWKARNAEIFTDKAWDHWFIINQINTLSQVVTDCFTGSIKQHLPKEIISHTPPSNCYKLNVDGSSLGNPGRSGFGGIIRNWQGEWCTGFSGFCRFTDNLNAELLAIYQGLKLAWQEGYAPLICESDSRSALSLIQDGVHQLHPLQAVVTSIHQLVAHPWQVTFQHVFREGNECADWLAKHGANMDSTLDIWDACPQSLHLVMLADASGVIRQRV